MLSAEPGAANLVVFSGAARDPVGDVVECDLAREAADGVLQRLCELGLERDGAIALDEVDTLLSDAADRAEQEAPGSPDDAVVWDQVEERTSEESTLSVTFLLFLTIATLIAGIGALLDQPILVVGAMVVGPEFGPVAALCVALARREARLARRSLRALVVGFPVAIVVSVLATLLGWATGLVEPDMLDRNHPLTDFISKPDAFSFVVAFVAGIAGILSLTAAKSGALVGVLISVTTVPAAGSAAVAIALGHTATAIGAAEQLAVNLAGLVVAGTLTLVVQRAAWRRAARRDGRTAVAPEVS